MFYLILWLYAGSRTSLLYFSKIYILYRVLFQTPIPQYSTKLSTCHKPVFDVVGFFFESNVVITRSNYHVITDDTAMIATKRKSDFKLTTDTPHRTLTDELWGVYYGNFEENWPRYKCTALYHKKSWNILWIYYTSHSCIRIFDYEECDCAWRRPCMLVAYPIVKHVKYNWSY